MSSVKLDIYDIIGKRITTLIDKFQNKGYYKYLWNGTDINGKKVGSGIYFYRLITNEYRNTKKMILLK